jgi:uncharacterized protein DUF6778
MRKKWMIVAVALLGLGACGGIETASRAYTPGTPVAAGAVVPDYSVVALNVTVPETLKVSEANRYYPIADIVWRGDPYGNRYQQVRDIFLSGMGRGADSMQGGQQVVVDVEVLRFHSLTEKTRYSIGGSHSITFSLQVRDAATGAILQQPRVIKADLEGFGGDQAIEAERIGQTQKVRIVDHLARVIQGELARPYQPGA